MSCAHTPSSGVRRGQGTTSCGDMTVPGSSPSLTNCEAEGEDYQEPGLRVAWRAEGQGDQLPQHSGRAGGNH